MLALHDLTGATFRNMLQAMSGQLAKADSHFRAAGRDPDRLLEARLAEDMFPLSAQVRFSCGLALECFARLAGEPVAEVREIARMEEAIALIAETLERVDALAARPAGESAQRTVELALPIGMTFDMAGDAYVRDWAVPQFYFHVLMTYAILRREGVPLGKADYVPHMARYLRS